MAETHTAQPQGHPKGLYLLFVTEMAERFSYYGMRALFTLYLVAAFFSSARASELYGSYTALVYLTPLVGGYIADRYWGNRRSIIVGGLVMALGQFLMFMSASTVNQSIFAPGGTVDPGVDNTVSLIFLFGGLLALIIGNGFFKPNISTMVGDLYEKTDKRRDSAFTIFYMGINVGAFLAPLVCGGLGEGSWDNLAPFKWGFLCACIAMCLSVLAFWLLKDKYLVTPEGKGIGLAPDRKKATSEDDAATDKKEAHNSPVRLFGCIAGAAAIFCAFLFWDVINGTIPSVSEMNFDYNAAISAAIYAIAIALPVFIITDRTLATNEKKHIGVIYIIALFVIFFWAAFEQAGSSLTIFADKQVDRVIMMPSIFTSADGWLAIAAYGLILTYFYIRHHLAKNKALNIATTKGATVLRSVISFAIATIASAIVAFIVSRIAGTPTTDVVMPTSYFQSVNPIVVVTFAPIMAALWGFLGKRGLEPASPVKQAIGLLLLSIGYFVITFATHDADPTIKTSMFWLFALYFIHTIGELCLSPIGLSMVTKLSPKHLASLLMGVWFMSNAASNSIAGKLASLLPEDGAQPQVIFGQTIDTLDKFFLIFALMSGIAALCLFALCPTIKKMMKDVA